jgi:hypothetical protein
MATLSYVLATVAVAMTLASANASLIDFNSNGAGFNITTALNVGGAGTAWTYLSSSAVCAGGSGGCWTIPDYIRESDQRLTTPLFTAIGATFLAFDHTFKLENTFDGGVVEISVNGGAFTDVTTLYGPFSGEGYTPTISSISLNPIGGRPAFTGVNTGGFGVYVNSGLTLALNNGDSFQLLWRMGTDSSLEAVPPNGWRLDNVNISSIVSVPEPETNGMALLGLFGLAYWFYREKRLCT